MIKNISKHFMTKTMGIKHKQYDVSQVVYYI